MSEIAINHYKLPCGYSLPIYGYHKESWNRHKNLIESSGSTNTGLKEFIDGEFLGCRTWLKQQGVALQNPGNAPSSDNVEWSHVGEFEEYCYWDGSISNNNMVNFFNTGNIQQPLESGPTCLNDSFKGNFIVLFSCCLQDKTVTPYKNHYFPSVCLFEYKDNEGIRVTSNVDNDVSNVSGVGINSVVGHYKLTWRLNELNAVKFVSKNSNDIIEGSLRQLTHAVLVKLNDGKSHLILGRLQWDSDFKCNVLICCRDILCSKVNEIQSTYYEYGFQVNGNVNIGTKTIQNPVVIESALIGIIGIGSSGLLNNEDFDNAQSRYIVNLKHNGASFLTPPSSDSSEQNIVKQIKSYGNGNSQMTNKVYKLNLVKRGVSNNDTLRDKDHDKYYIKTRIQKTQQQVWLIQPGFSNTANLEAGETNIHNECTVDVNGNMTGVFSCFNLNTNFYIPITATFTNQYYKPDNYTYLPNDYYTISYYLGELYIQYNGNNYLLDRAYSGTVNLCIGGNVSEYWLILFSSQLGLGDTYNEKFLRNCVYFKGKYSCHGVIMGNGNSENGANGQRKLGFKPIGGSNNSSVILSTKIALTSFTGNQNFTEFPYYPSHYSNFLPNETCILEDAFKKCYFQSTGERFFNN